MPVARTGRSQRRPRRGHGDLAGAALTERFGLLIIIVLGETLMGVVEGLSAEPIGPMTLAVGLVAVTLGFGCWWTYFDFAGYRAPRISRTATVQWMLTHLPLTLTIAAMGAAMVGLVEHAHDGRIPVATNWVLCAGVAIVLCTTMVIAASEHVSHREHTFHRRVTRTCAVLTIACAALGVARPAPLVLGLILVAILGVPWGLAVAHRIQEGMPMSMHKAVSPEEAADRLAIRELFDAYAHCADRRDAAGQLSLFTTDARLIVHMDARSDQPTQDLRGHEQILPVFENLRSYQTTTHFNGQSTIHLDGEQATGESYCLAHHLYEVDGQRTLMVASLRYLDKFAKQADGSWLFAERRLMVDWTETRPSTP